jgi:DNA-binding NarL/FixJ family response regulator
MIVRVLLVDDNESWRGHVRDVLEKHPSWEVVAEGANGLAAVQQAAALKPDVILLDIELPIQSGIAAARAILAADPQARILFISGHRAAAIVGAALETGARGYLLKSDADQLVAAVDAIARGDRFISDGLTGEPNG